MMQTAVPHAYQKRDLEGCSRAAKRAGAARFTSARRVLWENIERDVSPGPADYNQTVGFDKIKMHLKKTLRKSKETNVTTI